MSVSTGDSKACGTQVRSRLHNVYSLDSSVMNLWLRLACAQARGASREKANQGRRNSSDASNNNSYLMFRRVLNDIKKGKMGHISKTVVS
jgi:hypothetical protein